MFSGGDLYPNDYGYINNKFIAFGLTYKLRTKIVGWVEDKPLLADDTCPAPHKQKEYLRCRILQCNALNAVLRSR
jgi:hypothetical protein